MHNKATFRWNRVPNWSEVGLVGCRDGHFAVASKVVERWVLMQVLIFKSQYSVKGPKTARICDCVAFATGRPFEMRVETGNISSSRQRQKALKLITCKSWSGILGEAYRECLYPRCSRTSLPPMERLASVPLVGRHVR